MAKRRGRPRVANPKLQTKFNIDIETLEKIEYLAIELQISRSELIRRAIRHFLGSLKNECSQIPF